MNYSSILKCDIANGPGFRVSLWVSGCGRKCPGCFNQKAQDPNYGSVFSDDAKKKIFAELEKPYVAGFSLLGGEPMSKFSDNRYQCINLCREIKEKFPNKNIWIWSGYTFDEIKSDPSMRDILKYVDILVDGPFIQEQKDLSIAFRGSSNQNVINISKLRKANAI